jgi:hypothetical protein
MCHASCSFRWRRCARFTHVGGISTLNFAGSQQSTTRMEIRAATLGRIDRQSGERNHNGSAADMAGGKLHRFQRLNRFLNRSTQRVSIGGIFMLVITRSEKSEDRPAPPITAAPPHFVALGELGGEVGGREAKEDARPGTSPLKSVGIVAKVDGELFFVRLFHSHFQAGLSRRFHWPLPFM